MSITDTSTHVVHVLMYSLIKLLISSGLPQQQSLTIIMTLSGVHKSSKDALPLSRVLSQ